MRLLPFFYPFIFGSEICKKKLIRGEDCVQDFHSLGKFTTAFPWSYQGDASTRDPKAHRFPCTVDSPASHDVKMRIFNHDHQTVADHVSFSINSDSVHLMSDSHWHRNSSTVILVHGWNARVVEEDGELSNQGTLFVDEMLKQKANVNIVLLDWTEKAGDLKYWLPATNTQVVGALLGEFIQNLIDAEMNTIGDFHLAGHSLGAHICGYAAKWLKTRTPGKLPRISALDPAGPMFQFLDDPALNEIRVWKEDAEIVEVFHSNAGDLGVDEIFEFVEQCENEENARACLLDKVYETTPTGIGAMVSLGTHDYWPDGGKANHSYCEQISNSKPGNLIEYYVDVVGCSHSFSWLHWIATINNKCSFEAATSLEKFMKRDFDRQINVGFSSDVSPRSEGESVNFYYETLPDWPFGAFPLDDEENSSSKTSFSLFALFCLCFYQFF